MSVVAAYHIFVCALFLVQGVMWIASTHNNGIFTILTRELTRNYTRSLMMICNVLLKHVGAVNVF